MNNKDFFFCYDELLSKYLVKKGNRYITMAINPSTNNVFWLFPRTGELSNSIKEYKHILN